MSEKPSAIGAINRALRAEGIRAGNTGLMLHVIATYCYEKKGVVMLNDRPWVAYPQRQWFDTCGLKDSTGKRAWKHLVDNGFMLAEQRPIMLQGIDVIVMHVALTDKTYELLKGTEAIEEFAFNRGEAA